MICVIHDLGFIKYPKSYSFWFQVFYKTVIPILTRKSKHLITVSQFSKSEIESAYPWSKGKISIVYNSVNINFNNFQGLIPEVEPYLLAVSSLNERKNFISILKAFILTMDAHPSIKLYIIGDLSTKSFKKLDIEQYENNPRINFLGRVTDQELAGYYSNALGFLYPSLYEGFGIPPLEAQFMGCPVLVSDVSSLPEVFKDSALYCRPTSVDSIAKGIDTLISNKTLRSELIKKGKLNVQRFSWESSTNVLISILNNIDKK